MGAAALQITDFVLPPDEEAGYFHNEYGVLNRRGHRPFSAIYTRYDTVFLRIRCNDRFDGAVSRKMKLDMRVCILTVNSDRLLLKHWVLRAAAIKEYARTRRR
jgi:hypothetical protein